VHDANAIFSRLKCAPLAAACAVALVSAAFASSTRNPVAAERFALRFVPGVRYTRSENVIHLVTYDLNKTLRNLTGSRSNPVTILETRRRILILSPPDAIKETETNTRRYAPGAKDKSVIVRTVDYAGQLAPDGVRKPPLDALEDAGDGALDQLPDQPLFVGQAWSFSRPIRVERTLGQGTMLYTDTLDRIEQRAGKRVAIIAVTGIGRVDVARDLQRKGFKTATMALTGNAEFNLTDGLPGAQHYAARVEWGTRILFTHIGVIFDDTYDATPWISVPKT